MVNFEPRQFGCLLVELFTPSHSLDGGVGKAELLAGEERHNDLFGLQQHPEEEQFHLHLLVGIYFQTFILF